MNSKAASCDPIAEIAPHSAAGNAPGPSCKTCIIGTTARPHWLAGGLPTGVSNEKMFSIGPLPGWPVELEFP